MPAPDIDALAAEWLIRLDEAPSSATRAEFESWIAADPRHQAAFVRLEKTWNRADVLRRLRPLDGSIDTEVLDKFERPYEKPEASGSRNSLDPSKPFKSGGSTRRAPRDDEKSLGRKSAAFGIAAAILIVTLGALGWFGFSRWQWQTYRTDFGGFQRVVLEDGSTAMLNTDTDIRVRFTKSRRQILLARGEALFTVAHDVNRPFDVSAAGTVVRAVGAAFSVRLRDQQQVDVLVAEGRVALNPPDDTLDSKLPQSDPLLRLSTVAAGEAVSDTPAHRLHVEQVGHDDITHKLAWTEGRLWFDGITLAEAVSEFNRYNRRKIEIGDSDIANLHVGGSFDATDVDRFVAALKTFGIEAIKDETDRDSPVSGRVKLMKTPDSR